MSSWSMEQNILKGYPDPDELIHWFNSKNASAVHKVNSHIHTPYSFSAFNRIEDAFIMASGEEIKILGINDFYTTEGFPAFNRKALEYAVFPLFNIEYVGLLKRLQERNIRVNDPNNPGRIYFCGKGLDYPVNLDEEHRKLVEGIINQTQLQIAAMIDKTNRLLSTVNAKFRVSLDEIRNGYAERLVRERHIAKAIRIKVMELYPSADDRMDFLKQLYGGNIPAADPENSAAFEDEIRTNLLKKGGSAYVEEDERAFLPLERITDLIIHSGGIPCYPVLLDNEQGRYTEFEGNWEQLHRNLDEWNVMCIELIPGRNNYHILKRFVEYFHKQGFIILFGTEHNTPRMIPLTVTCRNRVPLDNDLNRISFEGACAVAAHQYLRAQGMAGITKGKCIAGTDEREKFILLGRAVIEKFISK